MTIHYFDALAGAGKTRALAHEAHRRASRGFKLLFTQPTKLLIDKTITDEFGPLVAKYPIRPIHGDTDPSVISKIVAHIQQSRDGGEVLFITQAAFMQLPYIEQKDRWHLIVDEVPQVDIHKELRLPETYRLITSHLELRPYNAAYGHLTEGGEMGLLRIAQNKSGDEVFEKLQEVSHRVNSDHWEVSALQDQYRNLLDGYGEKRNLNTFSLLQPSIFDGYASTVIAGACFEHSILYRLWTVKGVPMEPVHPSLTKGLRYDRHQNGNLITILYCTEEEWSKTFRNKMVEMDERETRLLDQVIDAVGNVLGDEPFLWMGNKDLKEDIFSQRPRAKRLPNSPHGLNQFQDYHNVVFLSALNPPPAHFGFMNANGISGDEVRTAHYRTAVYQAVMRCSARDPNDRNPKRFVVMDRSTADWLANLFPGAAVQPLQGMGVVPHKGEPGRKRQHESNAAKNRAYNERRKRELLDQLDQINGTSFAMGPYPDLTQAAKPQLINHTEVRDENTFYKGEIVTSLLTSGTAFSSIYDTIPLTHVDFTDDDSFVSGLRDLHKRILGSKEDSGLFSPAHFDPDLADETSRGLDNVCHVRGIWLDNDGGDLRYEEFARFFPSLRVVIWNTYSHAPEKPRWRAFIPTTHAMSKDVHSLMITQIEEVLKKKGYWSKKQLDGNPKIKSRLTHGFDLSKFNAASLFYLPCQAKNPEDSFFLDHNGEGRGPLDVCQWIENRIVDLRPKEEPEPTVLTDTAQIPEGSPEIAAASKLRSLQEKLLAERALSPAGWQERVVSEAMEKWQSAGPGEGHNAFFMLARALQNAGYDEAAIRQTLHAQSAYARSPKERRADIKDILRALRKRGSF
jgi:hypothetical protein